MASNFFAATVSTFAADNWVDGAEATTAFPVTGTGIYKGTPLTVGATLTVVLDFGTGVTQTLPATITAVGGSGNSKTVTWTLTDPQVTSLGLTPGLKNITATVSSGTGQAATSPSFPVNYITCFVTGTHIATPDGDCVVEDLAVGDLVLTASGDARPIKWIGHRHLNLKAYAQREKAAPVRICQSAFAENKPSRDLLLSPDHAVFTDGKLICTRQLVNGTTIRQELDWELVEYFHIELASHDVLLSEGLTVESYLDTGNRGFFVNADAPLVLHPDLTDESNLVTREANSCAPFFSEEEVVRPVWQRLAKRAAALGHAVPAPATTSDPVLRVATNGRMLTPLMVSGDRYSFMLPAGTTEVRLVSRVARPTDARPWFEDRRQLGVRLARAGLRGPDMVLDIPLDHPALTKGWWAVERDDGAMRRWTNGDGVLLLPPLAGPIMLEIQLGGAVEYVTEAQPRAA
jgi:hypothetical protein